MKLAVITCIFGEKDLLLEVRPEALSEDVEYFCITDRNFKSNMWKVIQAIPQVESSLALSAKMVKMLPSTWLEGFDYYLWVDGNIEVCRSPLELVDPEFDFVGFPIPWLDDRTVTSTTRFDHIRELWPPDVPENYPVWWGKIFLRKLCPLVSRFEWEWFTSMYSAGKRGRNWQDEGWLAINLYRFSKQGLKIKTVNFLEVTKYFRIHRHLCEGHPFG